MAQLGARLNGIQEVSGSIPLRSTSKDGRSGKPDRPSSLGGRGWGRYQYIAPPVPMLGSLTKVYMTEACHSFWLTSGTPS